MQILLTGSVAFDYLMTFPGNFKEHFLSDRLDSISLSFLVDSMVRLRGGVAPNIAYTLALLGNRPHLWVAVGEDFEDYRAWLESKGVDTSGAHVFPGEFTASFFVTTDRTNAQIASFFPGAMASAGKISLRLLGATPPDLVVISPNDPSAMNLYIEECQDMGIPYIYDPSQQVVRLSGEELHKGILGTIALFVNEYEYALVQKMTGMTSKEILENKTDAFIVITRGVKGATILTRTDEYQIPIVPPVKVVDPTGVGDAFRGGFLSGYSRGIDLRICGCMGALAATYCLEQQGPQGHSYTPEEFLERFRSYFKHQINLEL